MTVTELGLRSPRHFVARRSTLARRDGRESLGRSHKSRQEDFHFGGMPGTEIHGPRPTLQRITLHIDGRPETCAYLSLIDAVASLSRRPFGRTYEVYRGGERVFRFGVSLETARCRT